MAFSVLMHLNTSLTLPESIPVNETVVSMSFPSEGAAENLHSATLARLSLWILNRVPAAFLEICWLYLSNVMTAFPSLYMPISVCAENSVCCPSAFSSVFAHPAMKTVARILDMISIIFFFIIGSYSITV